MVDEILEPFVGRNVLDGGVGMFVRHVARTEPAGDLLTLPIARVKRDGSGHFAYDPDFVPPVLQVSSSAHLMAMMKRLIELLHEKSATVGISFLVALSAPTAFAVRLAQKTGLTLVAFARRDQHVVYAHPQRLR